MVLHFFQIHLERKDGKGFANFFYETFTQKEAELHQETAVSKEPPTEKAEAPAAPTKEADQPAQEALAGTDSPPDNGRYRRTRP